MHAIKVAEAIWQAAKIVGVEVVRLMSGFLFSRFRLRQSQLGDLRPVSSSRAWIQADRMSPRTSHHVLWVSTLCGGSQVHRYCMVPVTSCAGHKPTVHGHSGAGGVHAQPGQNSYPQSPSRQLSENQQILTLPTFPCHVRNRYQISNCSIHQ